MFVGLLEALGWTAVKLVLLALAVAAAIVLGLGPIR